MKRNVILILCLVIVSILGGCAAASVPNDNSGERFYLAIDGTKNDVYVDKETGVMYFFRKEGYGGGLTVMVDENGKPLIWGED